MPAKGEYTICNVDRAAVATLAGLLAERSHRARMRELDGETPNHRVYFPEAGRVSLELVGSAGQGFAAFLVPGIDLVLRGEANDSVAKSMSGGRVTIVPPAAARFHPHDNAIIGNGALYGATGGTLFVHGRAGDRFAVRCSGAEAVVEGAGLHACEYMTGGTVVVLGSVSGNAGAGMTGGTLWLPRSELQQTNTGYVAAIDPDDLDLARLRRLLHEYIDATGSETASALLHGDALERTLVKVVAKREVEAAQARVRQPA
jgi:glutamate synthase domain-containing protein 3